MASEFSPLVGSGCRGVREMQGAQGQLTSSQGPVRMGICHHEHGIAFPIKNIFLLGKYAPTWIFYECVQNKKSSLCRLKINHRSGSEPCVYSWYTGPHGSEQLMYFLKVITFNFCQIKFLQQCSKNSYYECFHRNFHEFLHILWNDAKLFLIRQNLAKFVQRNFEKFED